ncbi:MULTISPECIES: tyrosine-type recombinase/integrase [Actinomycetes]|uniref:Phage integrase/recombinase n=2 Tax=Actinomycetes TaxID=1760 RepID=A0A087DPZ7_9BIFI|nr:MULTISPECIES: tyrosine-type recombinase/integrase [Actinomycetes]KFI97597.1 phage integrase/recombinase [Bifidobacterium subtile]MCH3974136.1 tyrosine-type recombinase/integrase [Bifidobacterium tibiigranuli]QOL37021.1 tyrosine-type recombinase/integrase [Bifidobacterium subtile]SER69319.1 Site-specific recombinase XerD [Propionibacterium cyclohexanicum]
MSDLRALADSYLATRRALGFKLTAPGKTLDAFVTWMDEHGEPTIRRDLATEWVLQFSRRTVSERLNHIRQFAQHAAWFDPATEIPLVDGNPYGSHRAHPMILTPPQVDALLSAAGRLSPTVRAASWQTLLGLLTVTGLRISEARNLNDTDITADEDSDGGWLRVTDTKFGKSRLVPIHASTLAATRRFQRLRDRTFPEPKTTAVFVARRGTRIARSTAGQTFQEIRTMAGLSGGPTQPAVRLHDLRHSFATNTLIEHIRAGGDVDQMMPVLSTWLGHVSPESTYWYLSNTPELAAALAERIQNAGAGHE